VAVKRDLFQGKKSEKRSGKYFNRDATKIINLGFYIPVSVGAETASGFTP
jgi:hypothetical protein